MLKEDIQKEKKNPNQQLADALERAKSVSINGVIRSANLDRGTREKLVRALFLTEVMRGWYLLTNRVGAGTTTLWYSNYWEFIRQYLEDRFGPDGYSLSAESSLDFYSAQNIISQQLVAITKKKSNQAIELLHGTSLLLYNDERNFPPDIFKKHGLNLFPLSEAICRVASSYFQKSNLNAEICLKLIPSAVDVSRVLLELQSPTAAGRVIGAFLCLGDKKGAEQMIKDLAAAGHSVTPQDPFDKRPLYLASIEKLISPYAGRLKAMWESMRNVVIENFPKPPAHQDSQKSLNIIERLYSEDAYHSLSIEGYQVSEDLIRKIKEGAWNPVSEKSDHEQKNALAAKGYLGTFRSVTESVSKAMKNGKPGELFANDLQSWYRELFAPLVQAGLMAASDLAGFRNHPVYIAGSRHVPPPKDAVLDSMEALERLLITEPNGAVRAVLGHFIFVFVHPYMDGNGRIGRFLMNLMLVSAGYNWTVIRTSERTRYMATLEAASTQGQIKEFTKLIVSEMQYWKQTVSRWI